MTAMLEVLARLGEILRRGASSDYFVVKVPTDDVVFEAVPDGDPPATAVLMFTHTGRNPR